ncbi:unnamed protein product [Gadus morhua 'NCC']
MIHRVPGSTPTVANRVAGVLKPSAESTSASLTQRSVGLEKLLCCSVPRVKTSTRPSGRRRRRIASLPRRAAAFLSC